MPALSTHFRLATLVMPSLGIVSHTGYFLLGTNAPDAFEPDSKISFSRYHFRGVDGKISLSKYLKMTGFIGHPSDDPVWSFTCGYYCHLWLDVFYTENTERIPFKRPIGMPDSDLRNLVRREAEILNAPFVLKINDLPVPDLKDLKLQAGLEFIDLERCAHLFHEVLKQSRAWSNLAPKFESIDPEEYASFLGDGSKLFLMGIQAAS